jgi:photosystem II stability/assembly factor-like uncharacterized protein
LLVVVAVLVLIAVVAVQAVSAQERGLVLVPEPLTPLQLALAEPLAQILFSQPLHLLAVGQQEILLLVRQVVQAVAEAIMKLPVIRLEALEIRLQ